MGIVRFALRFPYTFYVLAALIVFLGISAITVWGGGYVWRPTFLCSRMTRRMR